MADHHDTGVFASMRLDHLRLHVADTRPAADWLTTLGLTAYATGNAGTRRLAMGRNRIRLVLDQPTRADQPAAEYVRTHGDGVADIALHVTDAARAFHEAVRRGATPLAPPYRRGDLVTATIAGLADVTHTFVERRPGSDPRALPGLTPTPAPPADPTPTGLIAIDHLAVCVPAGQLDRCAEHYQRILDFETTFTEHIAIGAQAVRTRAVQSRSGTVTLTLIEPDRTGEPGQIDRFLRDHGGVGVQHIAFAADDIVETVGSLARDGVRFLSTPPAYYHALPTRLAPVRHSIDRLRELDILADTDHGGQLFQIFAKSVHPRDTLFVEVIERQGARTFGGGNITALYESVRAEERAETAQPAHHFATHAAARTATHPTAHTTIRVADQ
ncbi:4-hydroxyphenylpyruvate dioxygenase [Embleya sp. AB8]|uniref:4-hydroxyphenylpyruvate dioxygenase n=1 Tax=Embleya sp. AB8 TaxID=3156304 RepID=UPI003C741D55